MSFFDGAGGFLRSGIYQDPRTRLGFLVRPLGVNLGSHSLSLRLIAPDVKRLRTPVVFHDIRSRRGGEEVPRRFWEYRSLERSPWGTSPPPRRRGRAGVSCLGSLLKRLVWACRRIACGSRTRRPPITSFTNPVICTRGRGTFGNGQRCSLIVVYYG